MSYSTADAFLGIHSRLRGRNFDAGDSDRRSDSALYGRRFVAHDVVRLYRRPGNGIRYFFQALGVTTYPAWEHLIVGGFAFGAVFIADPVTSAQTVQASISSVPHRCARRVDPCGQSAYPEGMMLAILFMNALAPLVDYCVVGSSISRRKNVLNW